jgi:hypothetical protein
MKPIVFSVVTLALALPGLSSAQDLDTRELRRLLLELADMPGVVLHQLARPERPCHRTGFVLAFFRAFFFACGLGSTFADSAHACHCWASCWT